MKKHAPGAVDPNHAPHRRSAKRRRVFKGGWLVLADGTSSIRCFVKDISATGARIETNDPPEAEATRLKLTLSDGETLDAEIVRRAGLELGIRFLAEQRPTLAPPPEPIEQLVEQMEAMAIEDVLARIDALGLSEDPALRDASEALAEAYAGLYALVSAKVGPW
ncbi:PilZ domain-containing protein [Roseospira goensis]|uniref:PilZ domain-containing protein n=1 Tax=Roseospira goensis TaxID=391922 RepID=A0A7W6S1B7_9PROT|nr:hypothetical protein [Roseospira goensis]